MIQVKKMKKRNLPILLALLFTFLTTYSQAQRKAPKPKPLTKEEESTVKGEAGDYFKQGNFKEALTRYLRLFDTNSNSTDYNYKAGLCYLRTNIDRRKAADFLEYVSTQKDAPKDILFDLGVAYHANGEYDKAIETFEKFKEASKGKVNPKYEIDLHIEWCYNAAALQKKPVNAVFQNMGKVVNTNYSEYRPLVTADDSVLVFTSNRKGNTGGLIDAFGEIPSDIYYSSFDSIWLKAKNIGISVNSENYEESLFLTPGGEKLLVYRESPENEGDIFWSELKGKSYQKAVLIGQAFKTSEHESGACLSPDGKTLFFSSDRKGGLGGRDLYKCELAGGTWSKPINLGEPINSKYDEDCPYMHADGQTLFFTSNSNKSMGGYDIFKSVSYDGKERWSPVENIGFPLNSVYDDLSISMNSSGITAYISAVRDSGFGDFDIYKVTLAEPLVSNKLVLVKAQVLTLSGMIGKNLMVKITRKSTGTDMGDISTNASTGKFLAPLPPGEYHVKIISDKQGKVDEDFTIPDDGSKILSKVFQCQ